MLARVLHPSHLSRHLSQSATRIVRRTQTRSMFSEDRFNRPSPLPLPPAEQREFEELVRKAQTIEGVQSGSGDDMHPDARRPVKSEFEGDVNPMTGERGGPKREPVGRWTADEGDWSFKGRVSDF
ncbi:hypothetical protein OF83DRAFT_1128982 [Amylostereum chailletii]|nr:hypothetical protein OF83DRAFT_1128982 [Amylostereum chailletii]